MSTPAQPRIGRMPGAFAVSPLRHRDYRVLSLATVFMGMAYIGESVVLGWLLLERTDSAFVVGLGIALRAAPNFLLGIPSGAIADRMDRRTLLRLMGFVMALNSGVMAALAFGGVLSVGLILVFTFTGGGLRALTQAARQSYAYDIAGPQQAVGSLAMITLAQRVGGIVGSLAAGVIFDAGGAGAAYLALALCMVAAGLVMFLARTPGEAAPAAHTPIWQGWREYAGEIGTNRTLATLVALTAAVEVLGFSYMAALPSLARDVLGLGAEGLGVLNAAGSVGAIVAILAISVRGEPARRGRLFLGVMIVFGLAVVVLGNSAALAFGLIAIAVVSGLAALTDVLSQTLVQASVPNEFRGRAMGSWLLAIGFGPIGHIQMGLLVAVLGVSAAFSINGLLLVLLALVAGLRATRIRRL
ncbi:MAG TPA: MFS transporter [Dehalococcoidia bacterium]|nr:MFS transporter [Dehalococcoidia bacterium]